MLFSSAGTVVPGKTKRCTKILKRILFSSPCPRRLAAEEAENRKSFNLTSSVGFDPVLMRPIEKYPRLHRHGLFKVY